MSVAIGMPQPVGAVSAGVERRGRSSAGHDHPAERGHRRQRHGPPVAELADDELPLDLHPDDEEEDRHQQVVDDVDEVLLEHVGPDLDADVRRPERLVARLPRRVRPDERDDRRRRPAGCRPPLRRAGTAPAAARRGRARGRSAGRWDGRSAHAASPYELQGSTKLRRPDFPAHRRRQNTAATRIRELPPVHSTGSPANRDPTVNAART